MNKIILKGLIRKIEYSHTIGTIEYDKAELIVPKANGEEDVLPLRFKKYCNKYEEGTQIELLGNLRSYSEKDENGKNHVHLYVFTYFDIPNETDENDNEIINQFTVSGRICKIDELRTTKSGKQNIHFILANNIISNNGQKLNTYLPCVAFGKTAIEISQMHVSDQIEIIGRLNSRIYEKHLSEDEIEFRTAYECLVSTVNPVEI